MPSDRARSSACRNPAGQRMRNKRSVRRTGLGSQWHLREGGIVCGGMSFPSLLPALTRRAPFFVLVLAAALANAQQTLTLDDALRMAKERNGTVRAALYDVDAAHSRVAQALAAFFPT